jgi:hypothetical protein
VTASVSTDRAYINLCERVEKLEKQVEALTRKANPTLYQRCKAYLKQAGGNVPGALDCARKAGDDEAVKRLEDELARD